MKHIFNDGGRAAAGFRGKADDCAVRAVAIVTGKPYTEVYQELGEVCRQERPAKGRLRKSHPRTGVYRNTLGRYLEALGFRWVSCMAIGTGCKVHLKASELPRGRLVVRVSKHITAVIDGVLYDTFNCSRRGKRCVYGYWQK